MNKFKKIGLTALATSLVASSAYAAEVSVSGGAGFVVRQLKAGKQVLVERSTMVKVLVQTTALSFSASGEMDNGWTVSQLLLH